MACLLTSSQLAQYLTYIDLPPKFRATSSPDLSLEFLEALHAHHICAIPYENLGLHYARDPTISLDVQHLFRKFTNNGRGGYCMENSIFFNHVLRALGFRAFLTGARIRHRVDGVPQGEYSGWVHVVNIVTLSDDSRYMMDVGFGGDGATKPLPLLPGVITPNIGPQELRLQHEKIPNVTQELWVYQYRNGTDRPWNSFYCFSETEFIHNDFEVMNFYTSKHPESFQTFTVLVVKFLREGSHVYGKLMLVNGDVKQNLGGKTSLVRSCTTEADRVEALRDVFGITLIDEEAQSVKDALVNCMYPLAPTAHKRDRPLEVLALGLSRSGTESLKRALETLGYQRCHHGSEPNKRGSNEWVVWYRLARAKWHAEGTLERGDFDLVLGDCAAITGLLGAAFAAELVAAYPEARVVVNSRPVDAWYDSNMRSMVPIGRSWAERARAVFETRTFWYHRAFWHEIWHHFYDGSFESNARQKYAEHYDRVRRLVPEDRRLEWQVTDGWGPLCRFLGKPVPDVPFPRGNTPGEMSAMREEMHAPMKRRAARNMSITLGAIVAFTAFLYTTLAARPF
ncbi:hypothetical protein SLS58_004638 [Diplodia intermedia]|uniref:Arylamine N-acetyltransferase n=1 Tax=Diplodia intermedia TaxID=856260 RepID=A0ABR3TT58_9PEZI